MRRAPRYLSTHIRELIAGKIEIGHNHIFFLDRHGRVIERAPQATNSIVMRHKRDLLLTTAELRAVVAVRVRDDDEGRPISYVEIYDDHGWATTHTLQASSQVGHESTWIAPPEPTTTGYWLAVWGTTTGGTDTKNA